MANRRRNTNSSTGLTFGLSLALVTGLLLLAATGTRAQQSATPAMQSTQLASQPGAQAGDLAGGYSGPYFAFAGRPFPGNQFAHADQTCFRCRSRHCGNRGDQPLSTIVERENARRGFPFDLGRFRSEPDIRSVRGYRHFEFERKDPRSICLRSRVQLETSKDVVMLSGHISSVAVGAEKILEIVKASTPKVTTLMQFPPVPVKEVLLEVKFAEVDRTCRQPVGHQYPAKFWQQHAGIGHHAAV